MEQEDPVDDESSYYDCEDGMLIENYDEEEDIDIDDVRLRELSLSDFGPSPWKKMLLKNIDESLAKQSNEKKRNEAPKQKVFCTKPVFQLTNVANTIQRNPDNRIGDNDVIEVDEDDVSSLINTAIDNKSSNVLVRSRGKRLTEKQKEIKSKRIAIKPVK